MSSRSMQRQVLRLASGKQFPLQCPVCGPEACQALSASSAFPTERSIINASCGFKVCGKGLRGQLGLGWDQRSAALLSDVPVTSADNGRPESASSKAATPTAQLQQAFSLLLDAQGVAHIAGDGMDCVFGVGGSMGVVGSYHGGAQPVAKAEFQPLQALQHKTLVDICSTKRSIAVVSGSGHVYTWGSGYQGELGQGHTTVATAPTLLPLTEDAAEDAASMMMPPADEHRILSCVAGDGFVALAAAGGQVYVTGALGPKYADGVRSTVQVSPSTAENMPPPAHLAPSTQGVSPSNTEEGGAAAGAAPPRLKPQASRPTLLADGAPTLAAGKHHLVLAYPQHVLVAGDNSAGQATAGAPAAACASGRFPLWRALAAEQLPQGASITAAYAFGDCTVVEVEMQMSSSSPVRALLGWGALPAGMSAASVPLPAASAPAEAWQSLGGGDAQPLQSDAELPEELPHVSMDTVVHSKPVLLQLPHVPPAATVLGWWQGELLFA